MAQNAETSTDRDGNEMNLVTPQVSAPAIRGMQGQTWSETIRTDDQYYEMAFPRTLAVAERAWHKAGWELDWFRGMTYDDTTNNVPKDKLASDYHGFVSKLGCHEVLKLEKLGINYRVPPPGGKIESRVLTANSELPCTLIMYSIGDGGARDGSRSNMWTIYTGPVNVGTGEVVSLQSKSPNGRTSRVVVIEQPFDTTPNDEVISPPSEEAQE